MACPSCLLIVVGSPKKERYTKEKQSRIRQVLDNDQTPSRSNASIIAYLTLEGTRKGEYSMQTAVERALELKNIAVVGLSKDPAKAAHSVPRYLQNHGYRIYPVNPFGGEELLGERVYHQASEVEGSVDLVVIFRPSAEVLPVVEDVLKRDDLKGIWLQEGITSPEAELLAGERGLIFVQDKCMFKEHRRWARKR